LFVHRLAAPPGRWPGWVGETPIPHPVSAWSWRGRKRHSHPFVLGAASIWSGASQRLDPWRQAVVASLGSRQISGFFRSGALPAARQEVHRSGARPILAPFLRHLPGWRVESAGSDPFSRQLRLCLHQLPPTLRPPLSNPAGPAASERAPHVAASFSSAGCLRGEYRTPIPPTASFTPRPRAAALAATPALELVGGPGLTAG